MTRVGRILSYIVVWAFIITIVILPFFEKGVVFPAKISGKEIGKAIGENVRNWLTFYAEVIESFTRSFLKNKDP
jgi:hypothetical protein